MTELNVPPISNPATRSAPSRLRDRRVIFGSLVAGDRTGRAVRIGAETSYSATDYPGMKYRQPHRSRRLDGLRSRWPVRRSARRELWHFPAIPRVLRREWIIPRSGLRGVRMVRQEESL